MNIFKFLKDKIIKPKVSMWVYADGSYQAFFDDDNMFLEHTIVVEGNINGEMKRADIWG